MNHSRHIETFDRWVRDGLDREMEDEHGDVVRQVLPQLGIRPGEAMLDLGCGNGWATRLLAKAAPGATAIGVDVSPGMVARAEDLHSYTIRARYEVAAFEALPVADGRLDRVFSVEALYYAADLGRTLAEVARVLKPGGAFDALIDYYAESSATAAWDGCFGVPVHRLDQAGWRSALEMAGLAEIRFARVVDTRGPGSPADFKPSHCYADFNTWKAVREAGTLWMRARKP